MTAKIFAIAGTFFQKNARLSIHHLSETEGGTVAVVSEESMSHAFSGHAVTQEDKGSDEGYFEGVMIDAYGPSEFHGMLLEDRLEFRKYYLRTGNGVSYTYKKCGSIWIGTYEGDRIPPGITRCILTELNEQLFSLDPATMQT